MHHLAFGQGPKTACLCRYKQRELGVHSAFYASNISRPAPFFKRAVNCQERLQRVVISGPALIGKMNSGKYVIT